MDSDQNVKASEKTISGRIEGCMKNRKIGLVVVSIYIILMIANFCAQVIAGGLITIYAFDISQVVDQLAIETTVYEKQKYISFQNISAKESVFAA